MKTALRCVPSSANSRVTLQNWASTTRGRGCLARIRTGRENPNRSRPATNADNKTTIAAAGRAREKPWRRRGVTATGPRIWPTEYPLVSNATAPGNPSRRPAARVIVLIPMKVAPNRTAPMRAATAPEPGGRCDSEGTEGGAPAGRVGCDQRAHNHAHSAADGTAANPTTSQAPLPSQPDEFCLIAATKNVAAPTG